MQHYYTENLLGLKDVRIVHIEKEDIGIEITLHPTPKSHPCPHCKRESTSIHDYRMQRIQHIPIGNQPLVFLLRKRRFHCPHCQRNFTEKYDFVGRYQRRTKDSILLLLSKLKQISAVSSIAKEFHTSSTTLQRIFQWINHTPTTLPRVLCMDEFKGNTGNEKYQCILVNGTEGKIHDILPSRKQASLETYFQQYSKEERARVTYVVMDMCKIYADLARQYFPNAKIVADKFHFARQCFWALENVRKRCQQTMSATNRKLFKRSKSLLRKRGDRLTQEQKQQVLSMIWYDASLRDAYLLKESYYRFLNAKTRQEAKKELHAWLRLAKASGLIEFQDCIRAHTNWEEEILNHFDTGLTNGRTEGFNNKIKVIKRVSFGYRNFENFRRRILYCCS